MPPRLPGAESRDNHHDRGGDACRDDIFRSTDQVQHDRPDRNEYGQTPDSKRKNQKAGETDAPFIDFERVDIFLLPKQTDAKLRQLDNRPAAERAPRLRFNYPYDEGVSLYPRRDAGSPLASNIQAYLDPYARGGRDLEQADYRVDNAIAPRWKAV